MYKVNIFITWILLAALDLQAQPGLPSPVRLTLIPPSPVTDQVLIDIRAAINNPSKGSRSFNVYSYLDEVRPSSLIYKGKVTMDGRSVKGIRFSWSPKQKAGTHKIIFICKEGKKAFSAERTIEVIASSIRSTRKIDGAFMGFYHWSDTEGKHWNADIKKMTDSQWGELVDAQHEVGMNIIVMQELFRNQEYSGRHAIEKEGYKGRAYYPSSLYSARMPITAKDPVEAVLARADKNSMSVFIGVGLYAWFDFSDGSLEWHKKLVRELWNKYGHHPSFYGWYVSEEMDGGLGTAGERKDIVRFFRQFKTYISTITPEKPVMLATNSLHLKGAEAIYAQLLPNLDILCPFAFHRMPKEDYTGEQAASLLQSWCDSAKMHLWMDLEVFDFDKDTALVPRPLNGLLSDLHRFGNFEKIICYQFPGLMSSPQMSIHPGGEKTVELFGDYKKYLNDWELSKK